MINYFSYNYSTPPNRKVPFAVSTEMAPCPWNPNTLLLRIGIKGYEIKRSERPAANLVFLLDVSGSMNSRHKLPLLKSAFGLLLKQLTARDRVSIVVYAGAAGLILEPTPGDQRGKIMAALQKLSAGAPPPAAPASSWPTPWPASPLSRAASTASCWPPTATSTWAW